jgi:probable rRNA maturation factor
MNKVLVISLEEKFQKFEREIKSTTQKILKILGKNNVWVEIYLINSQKMRFLNKKFRGKNKTTTVLSFKEPQDFILPALKYKKIGEIYLNLTNNQQPTTYNNQQPTTYNNQQPTTYNNQQLITNNSCQLSVVSCRLLVHGLLHLLGYNHKKKSDRIRMEKMEKLVMRTAKFYK